MTPAPRGASIVAVQPYHAYPPLAPLCPVCQRPGQILLKSEIASSSWVWFAVLLVFCFPLCWVPLLSKQHYRVCSACGSRVGLA